MEKLLPEGIGPHEGKEYHLMKEGKKNLALFSDVIPDEFREDPANLDLGVIACEAEFCTVFYRQGYREEAEALFALNMKARGTGFDPVLERQIGHLLGYEDWQIDVFLRHVGAI
jgi:hypothetical protein